MARYDDECKRIEAKWQAYWDQHQTFRADVDNGTATRDASTGSLPQTSHHANESRTTNPSANAHKPPVADPQRANDSPIINPSSDAHQPPVAVYVLDMFPYPSGAGLHVGHPEGYTATDIVCRYSRMRGKHVLHPMGWDAFGLPAEDYAIKTGTHPAVTTAKNIETFKRQLKSLGFSYDWSREFATTDPDYYRWTQWIFLQLFDTWYDPHYEWIGPDKVKRIGKGRPINDLPIPSEIASKGRSAVRRFQDQHRLAYQHEAPVNWCPALGTVLANEEIVDGKSERGGHPVERVPLRQWLLRITAYADRLATELDDLQWPDSIKLMQKNWIGRSEGAEVDFFLDFGTSNGSAAADAASRARFEQWKTVRSSGGFPRQPDDDVLRIYTTRPDTLFGVTYMVLAPEHPAVDRLTTVDQRSAVDAYRQQAATKSDLDRTDLAKGKSGVFTGGYATNPANGERVPVWIADYVLISYGTGAIMAVPAHDERDLEFATVFQIEIRPVVAPKDQPENAVQGFFEHGIAINSGEYNGLPTQEFKTKITHDLEAAGLGRKAVNYRLRDWLFSRQRYWGEPFPIWHELDADGQPTGLLRTDDDAALPVRLPEMADFKPTGTPEPMLSKAPSDWLYSTASDGMRLKRETNTMPQWAGSCWYYLRFADPKNSQRFIDPVIEKRWLPVDLYVGGAEHAVLHLLYSRFWHKVLFDRGHVSTAEPFQRLVNQGMILGEVEFTGYVLGESNVSKNDGAEVPIAESGDQPRRWVSVRDLTSSVDDEGVATRIVEKTRELATPVVLNGDQVEKKGDSFVLKVDPVIVVDSRAYKMSKSRGNVINPDLVVNQFGADSLRLYEMFMGPLEAVKPWSMKGVEGVSRFLGRVWRMIIDEQQETGVGLSPAVQDVPATPEQLRVMHRTIKAVTRDIESLGFNTAISRMMEFVNDFLLQEVRPKSLMRDFVLLLSPFAPHIAEELWEALGHTKTLAYEPWPKHDEKYLIETEIEIPVQLNGKLRGKVVVPAGSDQTAIESAAKADTTIAGQLAGKTIVKTIVIPGKMVNFVVR